MTARDHTCRGTGCNRRSRHCDLDHEVAWAAGGPTNAANIAPLCRRTHTLKHVACWELERQVDGTTRWTAPSGRSYEKPLDTFPVDATRPRNADPPPF